MCGLFLAVFRRRDPLILAQADLTKQVAEVVRAQAEKDKETAGLMRARDEFALGSLFKYQEELFERSRELRELSREAEAAGIIRAKGIAPFMGDPRSMINLEIDAIAEALGISREEAVAYMRSRIPTEPQQAG